MSSSKRIMLDENLLIDELVMLGWTVFDAAVSNGLPSHIHHHSYEICYIAQGEVNWWVNQAHYAVKRGDYFVTKPGEEHGGVNDVMERCELYWLQFWLPNDSGSFPDDVMHETRALVSGLDRIRHRAFPAIMPIHETYQRLLATHQNPDAYATLQTRVVLYDILINVVRSHDHFDVNREMEGRRVTDEIRLALTWMDTHLSESFTVSDVADAVNMSVGYFQKRFAEAVGVTPGEYATRLRVNRAKEQLKQHQGSISDIAFSLGFSTSQYFATVFKKYVGVTPRAYRKQYQHDRHE